MDSNGEHISLCRELHEQVDTWFSSVNAFNGKTLSRRDDFISLCYLLLYLLNDQDLPFISQDFCKQSFNQAMDQPKRIFDRYKMIKN